MSPARHRPSRLHTAGQLYGFRRLSPDRPGPSSAPAVNGYGRTTQDACRRVSRFVRKRLPASDRPPAACPLQFGEGITPHARTVSPYRRRSPRQRANDFLPARPPSPRFRTGDDGLDASDRRLLPDSRGRALASRSFPGDSRSRGAPGVSRRQVRFGGPTEVRGAWFFPLIRYRKSHLPTTEPLTPLSRPRIRAAPLSFFAKRDVSEIAETGSADAS